MKDIKKLKIYLEQRILSSDNVVIVPHKNPDFDAIASSLGLSLIARKFKKPSYIIVDDPIHKIESGVQTIIEQTREKGFNIVDRERYLQLPKDDELLILTDVNKKNLIYLNDDIISRQKDIIIIDHHSEDLNTVPANYKFIDLTASSACEILTKLLCAFKIKYDEDIANYLLAGIYLDTNKMMKNITSDTMKMVTKLLENKASNDKVADFFSEDFISDRKVQDLVSNAEFFNYAVATVIGEEDREYTREELAKAADYLLKFKIDAAFAIGKIEDDIVSISARSKGKIDVGEIMQGLNGGGNQCSAATKIENCTPKEAGKQLTKVIRPTFYKK